MPLDKPTKKPAEMLKTILGVLFWVLVWQAASLVVGKELLLPTPLQVIQALFKMFGTAKFWRSAAGSLLRINAGFFLGLAAGCFLGAAAFYSKSMEGLLRPLILLANATPVASFTVLALIWINSANLSVFVSFVMVLPVVYSGVYSGFSQADKKMLEMSRVFRFSKRNTFRAVYLPAIFPSLLAACEVAVGLSWKSGVAAEMIGLPNNSIGERLHQVKINLMTPELFGWTALIILLCWVCGRAVLWGVKKIGVSCKALPPKNK